MEKSKGKKAHAIKIWDNLLRTGIIIMCTITLMIMLVATFSNNTAEEANIGSFDAIDFNDGWILVFNGEEKEVTLPASVDAKSGDEIVVKKKLPDDISDGMSLMARARLQDLSIYIDGKLREEYTTDSIRGMSYFIPSAYVVCGLNKEDASKEVELVIGIKSQPVTGKVYLSHGNNAWFSIIKGALPVNLVAFDVFILGIIILFISFFLERDYGGRTTRVLSFLMMDIGLWVLSESIIRQFLFKRPSLCQYFAYFTVELIGVLACRYFDEVQHKAYHERYLVLESLSFLQLIINILLSITGIAELYQTIVLSHIWFGLCIPVAVFNIISDIRSGKVKEYYITIVGMVCFTALSLCELLGFYINKMSSLGTFICLAMVLLMTATILQAVHDISQFHKEREYKQTEMTVNTIEIIASAIDARDEYTGGHSERVGLYAGRLARQMASDYGLTERDILRIRYIGLLHDIGKIGVADNVLNKSGKLTDEEFGLMKKHPEIGYEIMSSLGDGIQGLLDGIRHHHERYDGKGYPDGLSGKDIPLVARILAIADSYDAMTSNRVYRKRLSDEEVTNEIMRCSGSQFDPDLAEIFLLLIETGGMSVNTVDGAAADESGKVRSSAMLESRLQKDLLQKEDVLNPEHVRMLCYVMKLMEKKGKDYCVLFIGFEKDRDDEGDKWEKLDDAIKQNTDEYDMNVQYTPDRKIVALYGQNPEEAQEFIEKLKAACPGYSVFAEH